MFNSYIYIYIYIILFVVYWLVSNKYRWIILLFVSYLLYSIWGGGFILLLFTETLLSFFFARIVEKTCQKKTKKIILSTAIICLISILVVYKYFNFLSENITRFLNLISIPAPFVLLQITLPLGISFFSFQIIGYLIDVYRGEVKAEHHFGRYATFISFFPQLVAGPIERTKNLLPQICSEKKFEYTKATYGLKLMLWGYFKKIIISDTVSEYVKPVFENPYNYRGFALVLAVFFFSIQIYCDFSGYSDIAIGSAKLLGIDLMSNFKSPYFSQSVREFWSRWHISLSTWLKDYVYIPLGGNRKGKFRTVWNLMLTFFISGLWHGASWTFVVWGLIHGVFVSFERLVVHESLSKGFVKIVRVFFVFVFCSVAWVFFASESIQDAFYIILHFKDGLQNFILYLRQGFVSFGLDRISLIYLGISVVFLFLFDFNSLKYDVINEISQKKKVVRYGLYLFFSLWFLFNIPVLDSSEFIYFQF